jgi:hypothetical protein
MRSWIRELARRSCQWRRATAVAAQKPAPTTPLVAIEANGEAFRMANVTRRGGQVELSPIETFGEIEALSAALARHDTAQRARTAAVVTVEAAPGCGPSCDASITWRERLGTLGIALKRVYPLVGAPLLALERAPRVPLLYLQVEAAFLGVMGIVRGEITDLEVVAAREPVLEQCRDLVGAACPEVLLAGGRPDLSEIGYGLARAGDTWVRILRPEGERTGLATTSLAALVGAARHASGLRCFEAGIAPGQCP